MYRMVIITNSKLPDGSNNVVGTDKDYTKEQADAEISRFAQLGSEMYYPIVFPNGGQVLVSKKDVLVFQLTPISEEQLPQEAEEREPTVKPKVGLAQ